MDDAYRKQVLGKVSDPVIRQFWEKEFANYNDRLKSEAIAPIQNKVGQFPYQLPLSETSWGRSRPLLTSREIMDTQKILIMNLSKGSIGEDASAPTRSHDGYKNPVSRHGAGRHAGSGAERLLPLRGRVPKLFYRIASPIYSLRPVNIASTSSWPTNTSSKCPEVVQNAIFGNCGTLISFRVGAKDAKRLVEEMGTFNEDDFVNLPKYSIYLKLMIDGLAGQSFSAMTMPPGTFKHP